MKINLFFEKNKLKINSMKSFFGHKKSCIKM